MGKLKRMDQIKSIIQTFLECGSVKATARRLGVSRNTVRQYIRQAREHFPDLEAVLSLCDETLEPVFYEKDKMPQDERKQVFSANVPYWLSELPRVGVTRYLLWEEYRSRYPGGYAYSQFCERLKREIDRSDLTLAMTHKPGHALQVDFAGKKMHWVEAATGEVHYCEVLVAVLPFSQYTFAIALKSQKVRDFIHGLNQAFLFFERIPGVILSDNLKSFVIKSDRYDPTFNEVCVQLAAHYQLDLDAARAGKPKDKASVENMVSTAYRRIYAPLRDTVFHSMEEINQAILEQLDDHNRKPFQKRAGSRMSVFEGEERDAMRLLPCDIFELKKTVRAKVQRNYHVFLGEEKNFYSVPYQHTGKQATVVYNTKTVEIFVDNHRVATHSRLCSYDRYRYKTEMTHLPKNHLEWRKAQGYDAAYFLKEARKIGDATDWAIRQILLSKIHEAQTYNSCRGILHLAKRYSDERVERACFRCQQAGKVTYKMLQNILERKLDQVMQTPDLFSTPDHDNIRGPEAYQ